MNTLFKILILFFTSLQTLFCSQLNLTKEEQKWLENNPRLTVANIGTYAPFNFTVSNEPHGYSIEYMNLISKYIDVEFIFVNKTWLEHIEDLKNSKLDIIPHFVKNEDRLKYADFTDFYHLEYFTGMAVLKDSNISSLSQLRDKNVSIGKGTWLHKYVQKNFPEVNLNPIVLKEGNIQIEDISFGKSSAYIGSIPTINYHIRKNLIPDVETKRIKDIGISDKIALPMAVKKGNTTLVSILEKANAMIPQNEVIKLQKKWFGINDNDISFDKEDISKIETFLSKEEKEYLSKKAQIKMCVLPNWLPFEQIDENGKHKGIGADMMKLISKNLNKSFVLVPTKEWKESLDNIKNKKCDILPVAMDVPSRGKDMNFTKPYTLEPFVIATKPDKIFIKDSKEIGNKKIGIVKDYAFIEVLKQSNPKIQIITVKDAKDGLERVRSGEIYGYVDIVSAIVYTIQENSMVDLKIAGKLEFDIKLSVASRNDEPLLNSIMQKSLDLITQKQVRDIVSRWLSIKIEQKVDYLLLWQISVAFILVILVILYKNREVNKLNKKLITASSELTDQQEMVNKYVMILTTDLKGQIIDVNEAYCKKVGFSKNELIGSSLKKIRHPMMSKDIYRQLWNTIRKNQVWTSEIQNLTKDKKNIHLSVVIEPLFKDNKKIGYRSISEDITDKKRIEELSITDKLTGLYNRLKIDELLLKQIEHFNRYETSFSIILLDIDNFKHVNDTYGHDVGDNVLKEIAFILKDNIRKIDEAGRWGGEEFLLICTNTSLLNAKIVAENIRKNIEDYDFKDIGRLTVSLGVSTFLKDDNSTTLFKRVDSALYKAKNSGKNRTVSL